MKFLSKELGVSVNISTFSKVGEINAELSARKKFRSALLDANTNSAFPPLTSATMRCSEVRSQMSGFALLLLLKLSNLKPD